MPARVRRGGARAATALLLAAAALAAGIAGCGGGSSPTAGTLVIDTFRSHRPIDSGRLALAISLAPGTSTPAPAPALELLLAASFRSEAGARPPSFALRMSLSGSGVPPQPAGMTYTGGQLFFELGGVSYHAPSSAALALEQGYAQGAAGRAPGYRDAAPALGLDPRRWLTDPRVVGHVPIDGARTVHVHTTLALPALLGDVRRLLSSLAPGLGGARPARLALARVSPPGGPEGAGSADLYTGAGDHIMRRLAARASVPGGTLALTLALTGVNQPVSIVAPRGARSVQALAAALAAGGGRSSRY